MCIRDRDWDGVYPYAYHEQYAKTYSVTPILKTVMWSYVPVEHVWRCPQDTGEVFTTSLDAATYRQKTWPFYDDRMYSSSYGWPGLNWRMYNWRKSEIGGKPVSYVKNPSMALLLYECRPWHGNYRPDDYGNACPGLVNIIYCDGHADRKTIAQWHANLRLGVP